jgi:prophage tail gpP-like protein
MSWPVISDNPELDTTVLEMPDLGLKVDRFIEYHYSEDFFTPSDEWTFAINGDQIPSEVDAALIPGTRCQLVINGHVQSTGTIGIVNRQNSRGEGTVIHITGYDILGPVVDAHVDPSVKFNEGMVLETVVASALAPFGLETFSRDNNANLNVITGQKKGAPGKRRALKSFTVHQLKPYEREGAFAFCGRIIQRFGLWMWPDANGELVIIGKVDGMADDGTYTMPESRYQLVRRRDTKTNNIIEGGITRDSKGQPSVILARGIAGGGEFAKAGIRSALVNPAITTDLSAIRKQYPTIAFKTLTVPGIVPYVDKQPRPLYMRDDESHTQEQLDAYCRREMSLLLRKHLVGHYKIKGHSIGGSPVAVDTIVDVDDDRANFHGPMWIEGRSFTKSRAGTTTTLTLGLPGCVVL